MERRILVLRHLLHLSVQFGGRCLVDPARPGQSALADGLQDPEDTGRVDVRRIFRRVETHLHMALRREIVDLVRTYLCDDLDQAHRVTHVRIMQVEVRPSLQMRDTLPEIDGTTADDAVHVIPLFQQEFRQVRTVLSGHAGNERRLARVVTFLCQVNAKCRLNLLETLGADAHFSGHPPGNNRFVLPDFLGQLPLGNPLPAQSGLDSVDNLVIYHGNKDTDYRRT